MAIPSHRKTSLYIPREYTPEPTIDLFHHSRSIVRIIIGPFGSGKTTGVVKDIGMRMATMRPMKGTNIRSSRWVFVANTIDRIRSTAIKTWLYWYPEGVFTTMSYGNQITGAVRYEIAEDGTKVEADIIFTSADDIQSAGKFKSTDLTGVWGVEISEFPDETVWRMLRGRIGRWPFTEDGGCSWQGMIGDTNAMREDNWVARMQDEIKPSDTEFFEQPMALLDAFPFDPKNPQYIPNEGQDPRRWREDGTEDRRYAPAENISHLPGATPDNPRGGFAYYMGLAKTYPREWVKVFVQNQKGQLTSNRPVYQQWNDDEHAARGLTPWRGIPLRIGFDWGLTPCAVICQLNKNGQWVCLEEVTLPGMEIGAQKFARFYLAPVLMKRYYGIPIIAAADPAGMQRDQSAEGNCFKELSAIGITVYEAPSQNIVARYESVAEYLDRKGGFKLDIERCPMLHKGFKGDYFLDKDGKPCKNEVSHVMNGLEYITLYTSVNPTNQATAWNGDARFADEAFRKMGFGGGKLVYGKDGVVGQDAFGNERREEHSEIPQSARPEVPGQSGAGEAGHWM